MPWGGRRRGRARPDKPRLGPGPGQAAHLAQVPLRTMVPWVRPAPSREAVSVRQEWSRGHRMGKSPRRARPSAAAVVPWVLRAAWVLVPFTVGPGLGEALADRTGAVDTVATVMAWAGWTAVLVALLVPRGRAHGGPGGGAGGPGAGRLGRGRRWCRPGRAGRRGRPGGPGGGDGAGPGPGDHRRLRDRVGLRDRAPLRPPLPPDPRPAGRGHVGRGGGRGRRRSPPAGRRGGGWGGSCCWPWVGGGRPRRAIPPPARPAVGGVSPLGPGHPRPRRPSRRGDGAPPAHREPRTGPRDRRRGGPHPGGLGPVPRPRHLRGPPGHRAAGPGPAGTEPATRVAFTPSRPAPSWPRPTPVASPWADPRPRPRPGCANVGGARRRQGLRPPRPHPPRGGRRPPPGHPAGGRPRRRGGPRRHLRHRRRDPLRPLLLHQGPHRRGHLAAGRATGPST